MNENHKQAAEKPWKKERVGKENIPPECGVENDKQPNAKPMPLATRPTNAATRHAQKQSDSKPAKEPVLTKAERRRRAHEARRAARSVHSNRTMRLSRASAFRISQMEDASPIYAGKLDFSSPDTVFDRHKAKRFKRESVDTG